jgi:predicted patatin/cPLA2 family phospholipase
LTETNRDRLPIETVLESLSRLPLEEEALLPFLKDLLVDLDNFRRKLQKWLEEAKELRRQTKQREEDWHRAYAELEQTLEELRNIEGSRLRFLNPIRHRDELDRAKQRYREALLQCKEIAPYHPALHDLLKSLE